ncbi:MAG TPA: DUF1566 domain-containing protein, partial [Saprospiraceae bacterium]|nr:DUF1566 domain-containing protein [Saprospiraceae bacterium]
QSYRIIDTGQEQRYSDVGPIDASGKPKTNTINNPAYFGQDADFKGISPSYEFINTTEKREHSLGSLVYDKNTGLTWMHEVARTEGDGKTIYRFTYSEAKAFVDKVNQNHYLGANDWRIPDIKELYSLILFTGSSTAVPPVPYLDTGFFELLPPNIENNVNAEGENLYRPMDGQFWSSTEYAGRIGNGNLAAFGVNFIDGRIKAYPTKSQGHGGRMPSHFLRLVRGKHYGANQFLDNGDGTITDSATGLMWTKFDSYTKDLFNCSSSTMDWITALQVANDLVYANYEDWRLPNAKELQSIVDYSRALNANDPDRKGPAIDPVFSIPDPSAWYWTGTTHLEDRGSRGNFAVVICFGPGTAIGPHGEIIDIHGAGAQRSSPKSEVTTRPEWFISGLGPQHDEVRTKNYIRCVREIR